MSQALVRKLRDKLGARYILDKPEELATYECDACVLIQKKPDLVALPKTPEEVAFIVQACIEANVPYTARGAGTGLSGGALPMQGGVQIGLNRMDRITEIDEANRTATVEVGVINASLNLALKAHGLFYAPDPSSQSACTLGGNIAENAGGIHCIKYGVTTDHILALQVVLPDGTLTWMGGKNRRSHGPNLVGLMVGSEGTLGVITQAIVKLTPVPEKVRVYLAAFNSVADAGGTVASIIQSGLMPSALEFMDAFTVVAVNQAFNVGFPENAEAVLLIELDGYPAQLLHDEIKLKEILAAHQVSQIRVGETEDERAALWKARKATVAAYGRYAPAFYLNDTVIPRSQLVPLLEKIYEVAERYDVIICNVFHAGDGNLHPHVLFDPDNADQVRRGMQASEEILHACLAVGGALSGEHGIGIEKSELMPLQFSPESLETMKKLKRIFDPANLSNPEKIFPMRTACGEARHAISPSLLTGEGLWI
ncbi:FAD-binding oxidoreductase [Vampirovibrio sp.]|uniref:FAD-binding oxidoreductase n=1 Tax=Vampirovibrio sp. TaxID=2717857 RepID=UPI0035937BEC